MTTLVRPEKLAADHIRELVRPFTTVERVLEPVMRPNPSTDPTGHLYPQWEFAGRMAWRLHAVTHPALLDQVANTTTTNTTGDDTVRPTPGSRPAGRLDALALLHRIDRQSQELAKDHNLDLMPLRPRLLALSGLIGDRPHHQIKSWWVTARIITSHDSPPWTPTVPCPAEDCDQLGALRIRLTDEIAVCNACQRTWADNTSDMAMTFGRLKTWVIWAADHLTGPRHLVPAGDHGYDPDLDYLVVCPECEPERLGRAEREATRLLAGRDYTHPQPRRATA